MSQSLKTYQDFRDKIDLLTQAAWEQYGSQMACKAGCFSCCRGDFKVSVVEAHSVREAVQTLSADKRAVIDQNLATLNPTRCPLLIDERCSIYNERPVLCRIFGYPIRMTTLSPIEGAEPIDHIATCEKNFTESQNREFEARCFDQKAIGNVLEAISRLYLAESNLTTLSDTNAPPVFTVAQAISV